MFAAILKSTSKQRVEEKDDLLHTSYVFVLSFVNKIKTSKPTGRLDCVCLYVLLFNFCLVLELSNVLAGIFFWSAAHDLSFSCLLIILIRGTHCFFVYVILWQGINWFHECFYAKSIGHQLYHPYLLKKSLHVLIEFFITLYQCTKCDKK